MKTYRYTCTLLSDVIITSVTATEGFNRSLDYIPGAKFLGIAAGQLYDKNNPDTLDLFHNGEVRFGDASPMVDNEAALTVPFSWYFIKGKGITEPPIFLHHRIVDADYTSLAEGQQLKQARKGYFSPSSQSFLSIEQEFAIRSAHDPEELRAKEGQMFGYFSLPKGSRWTFTVEDDTEKHGSQVKEALTGVKRIGRSRSAEYGLVEIFFEAEVEKESTEIFASGTPVETILYAKSNLCFYDQYGRSTLRPTPKQLGLPDSGYEILWRKSQIRSRLYQTWNRHRSNRDVDRMIIEKGSVFVVRHSEAIAKDNFIHGIGAHRSEGFGQVIVNPNFLRSDGFQLSATYSKIDFSHWTQPTDDNEEIMTLPSDTAVIGLLAQRSLIQTEELDKRVNEFLKKYKTDFSGITSSQWGAVLGLARSASDWGDLKDLLFARETGALYHGHSEKDWKLKNRRGTLEVFLLAHASPAEGVAFTMKLAAEMSKQTQAKEAV